MFKNPYAEVCVYDDIDEVTLFNERIFKGFLTIWLISSRIRRANCNFNAAAGRNVMPVDMIASDWTSSIRVSKKTAAKCDEPQN